MISAIKRSLDAFWGRGDAAITIPSMDGALRPNSLLDQAPALVALPSPDNLVVCAGEILFSSEDGLFALKQAGPSSEKRHVFDKTIACLAAHPSGALAVGTAGAIMLRGGGRDGKVFTQIEGRPLLCPTALAFDGPDDLIVCVGSRTLQPEDWKRDLMQLGSSGSVWRLDLDKGSAVCLADGLAFPYGVMLDSSGAVRVSESWRHRVLRIEAGSAPETLVGDIPGYPARMSPSADGGSWLTVFAPRRQMVEFVLRERAYRERMMREVHPNYWMAPALRSGGSFLEPIQGGAVRHLGISKAWAPTRSYGLVIRLDATGSPMVSVHSRADGVRHGVTSCLEIENRLIVACKGGGVIASVDLNELDKE
jgi:sugar lactone lactonase YvrE